MKWNSHRKPGFGMALALLILLPLFAAGCVGTRKVKSYSVEIPLPPAAPANRPVRTRLILSAADALKNPNLSRTDEYILRENKPLPTVLLEAAAGRMRAAGILPLEETEAALSSGRLLIVLTRLESKLVKQNWLSSAAIRAERYGKDGRLLGKWETIGRGAYPNSRLLAAGAGISMGKALTQALNKLPWDQITSNSPQRLRSP